MDKNQTLNQQYNDDNKLKYFYYFHYIHRNFEKKVSTNYV